MGKKLAIKGHETRGKEIIELLEMMGGINKNMLSAHIGDVLNPHVYFLEPDSSYNRIVWNYLLGLEWDGRASDMMIFTLEEFLEKYPYKVGDVIKFPNNMAEEIAEMKWDEELEDIIYTSVSNCIRTCHIPKNTEEEKINQMSLANCDLDEVEIVLGDKFELKIEDGKYYAVRKKLMYPNTYNECYSILNDFNFPNPKKYDFEFDWRCKINDKDYGKLMQSFIKLLICRDAYWKIAGEQMGLDKPWEPDWTNLDQLKCCIWVDVGEFITMINVRGQHILAFPTEEMRDIFYKNFKDLIEECKELL